MTKEPRPKVFRGDRMKEAREALKYSRPQFAELSGIDERQIKRYENGEGDPSGFIITLLVEALNVSSDWLYGLTNDPRRRSDEGEYVPTPSDLAIMAAMKNNDLNQLVRLLAESKPPQKSKPTGVTDANPKVESSSS